MCDDIVTLDYVFNINIWKMQDFSRKCSAWKDFGL